MGKIFEYDDISLALEKKGLPKVHASHELLEFKDLMKYKIEKILMVCSFYDYYTIVEDGQLQVAIFDEYLELNLYYAPKIIRASTGKAALKLLNEENFDLIISTLRLGDMNLDEFISSTKKQYPDIPHVLIASQSGELQRNIASGKLIQLDKIFIWSGDRRIFLAIVKLFEDIKNAEIDCLRFGIPSIILVEDSPDYYSSFLPLIYTELMKQRQKLIDESQSSSEKLLRQHARPKIFLATTYEEALNYYETYRESVMGIITDLEFSKNGNKCEDAGLELIKAIRNENMQMPILLQTSHQEKKSVALKLNVAYISKDNKLLLTELSDFMNRNFGFGDFVFKMHDGSEVGVASNLIEFRNSLIKIPDESLVYHSKNNHFSRWLLARNQIGLAYNIRPVHLRHFEGVDGLRNFLVDAISKQISDDRKGTINAFSRHNYDPDNNFQVIGSGSLGGKARGLAFIDKILKTYQSILKFGDVDIAIPKTIVIATDVFKQFMETNDLYHTVFQNISDERIYKKFFDCELDEELLEDLKEILKNMHGPIAVRSSSLLEDAVYQPFAGIYATVMIPNNNPDFNVRFYNLVHAVKLVYASTFTKSAKSYIEATGNRIEKEKMAVILQEIVGEKYEHYFYPHISGVGRSYNYYPYGKAKQDDGVVFLALGLGKTIVDGSLCMQYSPSYPGIYPQFGTTNDYLHNSQNKFWAVDLDMDVIRNSSDEDIYLTNLNLSNAEIHGTMRYLASTYSHENDALYEGISRQGPRILDFAPILKSEVVQLNKIIQTILLLSESALNCPVEIEFAATLGKDSATPLNFRFLQVRPMVSPESIINLNFSSIEENRILFRTDMALGNGTYKIDTVLLVSPEKFDSSKTRQMAEQINIFNKKLIKENRNYLLIGQGRWGSRDPWLGIPVDFSNISAAKVIVEIPITHVIVDPSQGSHFFHNLTSFEIAYLTVKSKTQLESFDWQWLESQPVEESTEYLKLIKLEQPITVLVNGSNGEGLILKD
ncbi:MAG: Phosphoenolpyruvate synthase [Ignavibacteria bacterium]|nr:Phosphoenolpyruvate synthase [Ignavibacteria bacterium]